MSFVLTLFLLVSRLILSLSQNAELAIFGADNSYPNSDECEDQRINVGEIEVTQDENNGGERLTPCIFGPMTTGDIFRVKWFQGLRELPLNTPDIVYEGLASYNVLLNGRQRISDVWGEVIPSSDEAFIEQLTVNLYSFDANTNTETLLDSFTVVMLRPVQSSGQNAEGFVIRTVKPALWRSCKQYSDDAIATVTSSNAVDRVPIYVCVLFFNPICENIAVTDGFTAFSLTVSGLDENGLGVSLALDRVDGPTNDPEFYECGTNPENLEQTFRYVTITNYPQLTRMTVTSEMDSYGELTERTGSRTLP